ncbi:hypothetical protein, partial [Stieleria sp.]|uniref:hypothetical protein n=1 Tax=Stieleria sp. TaxID=2795976 RepID=UPI003564DBAF
MPQRRIHKPTLTFLILLAITAGPTTLWGQAPTMTVVGPDGKPRTMPVSGDPFSGPKPANPNAK